MAMQELMSRNSFHGKCTACTVALLLISSAVVCAQSKTGSSVAQETRSPSADDYRIGPGDVLLISVADAPEFGGKFRVSNSGLIEFKGISIPIQAEGKSALELSHEIRTALLEAKQLRDPHVSVFIEEYQGSTVTVLGSVNKPGVYSLHKRTTVVDAISMAGGELPEAGSIVTVVRGRASAEATEMKIGSIQIIDINRLMNGEDPSANVEVRNEDVVSVSASQVVYVVGAVTKPGGFVLKNPAEGISVVQAVALAEGLRSVAAASRAVIVRQSTDDHARREIPVDVAQMMSGRETDVLLGPNDILYVPESGAKKTLRVMGDVAMAAADGIAIYGLGYRIGTR